MATGTANMASSARYFPSTIPVMLTGLVSSNWSVLLRFSSAKLRMHSNGMKISSTITKL